MNVRLSANLSMLFTEAPYLKRFGLAARHGFRAVEESLFPYGEAPASAVAAELEGHGTMIICRFTSADKVPPIYESGASTSAVFDAAAPVQRQQSDRERGKVRLHTHTTLGAQLGTTRVVWHPKQPRQAE